MRARREHGSYEGNHQVERSVLEGQILGIALDELNVDVFVLGACPGLLDEVRRKVDTGDPGTGSCRGKGQLTGAAGHVEYSSSRLDGNALQELEGALEVA